MNAVRWLCGSVVLSLPFGMAAAQDSAATIRSASCEAAARTPAVGFVEGYIRDARSDRPVSGVQVLFEWTDFTPDKRTGRAVLRPHTVTAQTARDGSFAACVLPIGQTMLMQAQLGERLATGAVEIEIPPSGALVETLHIATSEPGTAPVSGTLVHAGSEGPVEGAHLHVFGVDGEVVSTTNGSFRFAKVPIGTQSIEVTAPGLRAHRFAIDVRPDGLTGVNFAVGEIPPVLDTIKTFAPRAHAAALRDEFDQRAKVHAAGQYITETMIARTQPWRTTDLLRYVAGFEFRFDTVFSTRGQYEIGGRGACKPVLLIDGHPADTMNEVLPVAIHGIEVYPSSLGVPQKYPFSACGAILIWTK